MPTYAIGGSEISLQAIGILRQPLRGIQNSKFKIQNDDTANDGNNSQSLRSQITENSIAFFCYA